MNDERQLNSELFLQRYRVLEGLLEKRYEGRKMNSSSVVIEYLRDVDSQPVRVDLDLLREIRNILSHNADSDGSPVVEPSDEMLERLDEVLDYVRRPRVAADYGTPASMVLSAHLNDQLLGVMRNMRKNGYSHVPVVERDSIIGVFSQRCVFDYLAEYGFDALDADARISQLKDYIRLERDTGERTMFVAEDCSIVYVRNAFQRHTQRDRRLSTVFVTHTGATSEPLVRIITPWDVLNENTPTEETQDGTEPDRK